jgi:hypothetical protein
LVSLHYGLGAIGGTAVHYQNFFNCFWLSHETFKTSSDARCLVNNWKDDADLLGPRLMGDFNKATAGSSDETPNDAKSQEELQRAE